MIKNLMSQYGLSQAQATQIIDKNHTTTSINGY